MRPFAAMMIVALLAGCTGVIDDGAGAGRTLTLSNGGAGPIDASPVPDTASPAPAPAPTPAPEPEPEPEPPDAPPPAQCLAVQAPCGEASSCCEGSACEITPLTDDDPGTERCCRADGQSCRSTSDCCSYLVCDQGVCGPRPLGGPCGVDSDCGAHACRGGTCVDPVPPATAGFRLPWACGVSYPTTQGNSGDTCGGGTGSHTGVARYAFDFGAPLDTELLATAAGTVSMVRGDIQPGNPCYSGGGPGCANTVNYVVVDHGDGTSTLYLHINAALVSVGDEIAAGQPVARSGGTGWSTGPHLHIMRMQSCGSWYCQSVPLDFVEIGAPACGLTATSQNAC